MDCFLELIPAPEASGSFIFLGRKFTVLIRSFLLPKKDDSSISAKAFLLKQGLWFTVFRNTIIFKGIIFNKLKNQGFLLVDGFRFNTMFVL
ncbi:hypothetical protein HYN86_10750 [Flavobacterium fluviale]|uniref:Uncharacterized protein n=1 Tax=Flavobacterium fluviale TaxID=2249356 RepID=A0A344LT03_9FLAO|nr:hypothetical protein HYN86_10750 [Flavobacterium fluviale]